MVISDRWRMNWKGFGRNQSWPNFKVVARHLSGGLKWRKPSKSPGKGLIPGPLEYEARMLTTLLGQKLLAQYAASGFTEVKVLWSWNRHHASFRENWPISSEFEKRHGMKGKQFDYMRIFIFSMDSEFKNENFFKLNEFWLIVSFWVNIHLCGNLKSYKISIYWCISVTRNQKCRLNESITIVVTAMSPCTVELYSHFCRGLLNVFFTCMASVRY
jgi:hypothetical protein